jgi:hypothetical protein
MNEHPTARRLRRIAPAAAGLVAVLTLAGPGLVVGAVPVDAVPAHAVLVDTTTTTVPDTTTTTEPPTTTTTSSTTTTTTTRPTTTTTHPTTTTTHPSTTTTTTPAKAAKSSVSWVLIGVIVVVLLLIALVVALLVSRNRKSALDAWRRRALPALSDARLARDALLSPSALSDDAELRGAVSVQAERAAVALEQAASTAPEPAAGGSASTAAGALRGLAFAIEADRLLRNGAAAPTGVQLAQADGARRDRDAELQGALARLQTHVTPPTDGR